MEQKVKNIISLSQTFFNMKTLFSTVFSTCRCLIHLKCLKLRYIILYLDILFCVQLRLIFVTIILIIQEVFNQLNMVIYRQKLVISVLGLFIALLKTIVK